MKTIATLGPQGSHALEAAKHYNPEADIKLYPLIPAVFDALKKGAVDLALIPVYNTREGEIKEFFRSFANEARCNLHLELLYGEEPHHVVEALFKVS